MNPITKFSVLLLLALFSCDNKPSGTESENQTVQYLTPKQKSIHLFNLPDGLTERQFSDALSEMNSAISDLGYPGVGYHFFKVESDTIQEYRYFMEGLWPDPETYRVVHESEEWNQAADKNREMFGSIFENEIYRRLIKVEDM